MKRYDFEGVAESESGAILTICRDYGEYVSFIDHLAFVSELVAERDALKAEREELMTQSPVAWSSLETNQFSTIHCEGLEDKLYRSAMPLAIPEWMVLVPIKSSIEIEEAMCKAVALRSRGNREVTHPDMTWAWDAAIITAAQKGGE